MADTFVDNDAVFKKVDTTKIGEFIDKSPALVEEFENIKKDFNSINETLLGQWKGEGAKEYKQETDHILEKIGDLKAVIDEINNSTIKDIRKQFSDVDNDLGTFNREQAKDEE